MSRKMGVKLNEVAVNLSLYIINDGRITYRSRDVASAPDVTISHEIEQSGEIKWNLIDDML